MDKFLHQLAYLYPVSHEELESTYRTINRDYPEFKSLGVRHKRGLFQSALDLGLASGTDWKTELYNILRSVNA